MAPEPGLYPIGYVSRVTGLTPRQIRYYERAGLVQPTRTPGGHRLFSEDDLARLLEVRRLMQRGQSVRGIKAMWERYGYPTAAQRRAAHGLAPEAAVPLSELAGQLPGPRAAASLYPLRHPEAWLRQLEEQRARVPRPPAPPSRPGHPPTKE